MPNGWFLAQYAQRTDVRRRYCVMDDYTAQIAADGGSWREVEILGNEAICKVRASAGTLTTITADVRMTRIPKDALDDSLASLTVGQRTAIRNKLIALGYSGAEITAALTADVGNRTVGDVLRFAAGRRQKPRFDSATSTIVLDGPMQPCLTPDDIDSVVI